MTDEEYIKESKPLVEQLNDIRPKLDAAAGLTGTPRNQQLLDDLFAEQTQILDKFKKLDDEFHKSPTYKTALGAAAKANKAAADR